MSGGGVTPDSVSLAIAFHQAPGRFPDLLHGRAELPGGVGLLLRLAGSATPESEGFAAPPFVSAEEIRAAALFFIEHALLAHEADHYRVLGVRRDASLEEIKEHHRLLMRLFHPDREGIAEGERKDTLARCINLAYTALRQPQARSAYDTTLQQARKAAPVRPPTLRRVPGPVGRDLSLPPAVARHLPQVVLGGFAMLATLAVGTVYLTRQPAGAIGAGEGVMSPEPMTRAAPRPALASALPAAAAPVATEAPATLPAALQESAIKVAVAKPDEPVAAPPVLAATPQAAPEPALAPAPEPVPMSVSAAKPVPMPAPSAPPAPVARIVAAEAAAKAPPAAEKASKPKPAPERAAAVAKAERHETPPQPPAAATAAESPRSEAVAAAPAPSPAPDNISEELVALVQRLSALYEKGDLEGFLALFDEEARAELGGKARIRSDYENLFRTTEARKLTIYDLNWVRDGDRFRGEGGFQAKVVRKGENAARIYNGTIKLEVQKRKGHPLIRGIFHKTG